MASDERRMKMEGEDVHPDFSAMDQVRVVDKGGNALRLQRFNGRLYFPYYKPSDLQGMKKINLREDDIYISSYPRTGTHWTFELSCMLMNGSADTIKKQKGRHEPECQPDEVLAALPSPRVLNSHLPLSEAPEQLAEKKCKIILTIRDPKDVAVSLFHIYKDFELMTEYKGKFEDFIYLFLEGKVDCDGVFQQWRDCEKFFDEHPGNPVHILPYEDMKANPLREVQKLSDFLGVPRNDELCQAIADKCQFSRMKVDKSAYGFKFDESDPIFRKGVVGDWRNHFTEEMLEEYYRVYEEKMNGSRFYDRYSRDKDQ